MLRKSVWIVLVIGAAVALAVTAGQYRQVEKAKTDSVTLSGTLVCMGCDLKKNENARAACSEYGHTHALKTEDGKYINFLQNNFSADLLKGEKYHNQKLEVQGIYYADANLLDVEAYQPEGGKKNSWCDHCGKMDACMKQ